jgi:hypothetical protein
VKRYILPFDVWDKRLDKIVGVIGKSRKEGKKWSGEVSEKEMRRLVISGIHYIRQGYSRFKIQGLAKLWANETGKTWPLNLLIK